MTNSQKTLLAALLDRSGSMITSKEPTERGWRELIEEQATLPGDCRVTLAQFDTEYNQLYSTLPITQLPEFHVEPRWGTALLDAMGKFITDVGEGLAALPEDDRPGKVICLVMTDGMENSSKEWTLHGVRQLVTQQREQWAWEFIFMGANMDAVEVAQSMGISRGSSITYDAANATANVGTYAAASGLIANARAGAAPEDNVFSEQDRDAAVGKKKATSSGGRKR